MNTYGIKPIVVDPWASERDAMHEYGVTLTKMEEVADADCVIVAVAHNEFKALGLEKIKSFFKDVPDENKVLIDVKGLYPVEDLKASGMRWWRL
jgi:UDP-N-acetyl-D-galactosamine dehydrogenase